MSKLKTTVRREPLTASVLAHNARRKNRLSEDNEQILFAKYADKKFGERGWIHPSNEIGQSGSIGLVMKAKRKGVKKGFPDILIFQTTTAGGPGGYKGLAIELKRQEGGKQTPDQKAWDVALECAGWLYMVCRGAQEAVDLCERLYPTAKQEKVTW
jgi:hypothetical protein